MADGLGISWLGRATQSTAQSTAQSVDKAGGLFKGLWESWGTEPDEVLGHLPEVADGGGGGGVGGGGGGGGDHGQPRDPVGGLAPMDSDEWSEIMSGMSKAMEQAAGKP